MATQTNSVRPALADVYFDWESEAAASPAQSIGGVVAVAATDNWGPVNTVTELDSYDDYLDIFGGSDTPLRRAVFGAFKGQGVNGQGGAGSVLAYRQATNAAVAGHHALSNTTPAAAINIVAKYPGTRANDFSLTVQSSPVVGSDELVILDGAVAVEKFDYVAADISDLVDQINELSEWFTATLTVDGVALTHVSSVAITSGADGDTLSGSDWTATFAAFDRASWGIFPAYGLTDPTIRASVVAWIQLRNSLGNRCFAVFGGASAESLTTAAARSAVINDYNIINLGEGTLHLTDDDRDCSTAEFVTRYAGARAWRGERQDDIFVRFGDVDLIAGATLAEQALALSDGVVVFSRDTNADAPVFIREAVNTYTDDSLSPRDNQGNKTHPVALYKRIKNIAIQQGIELEVGSWARGGEILGDLPVNDKTRNLVLGRVTIAYSTRETAQVVQPGWTVALAAGASDDDDFVSYVHGFHPTRSVRQIFNTVRVG